MKTNPQSNPSESPTASQSPHSVQAVILDWAGTAVDHGCLGPMAPFINAFAEFGVVISTAEARGPMGLPKRDHVVQIFELPDVQARWRSKHNREANVADIDAVYARTEPLMIENAPGFSVPIPGSVEFAGAVRERGIALGSTTGYTRAIMDVVTPVAAKHGYAPDCIVTPEDAGGIGRPAPFMCYENARRLGRYPLSSMIKIGDTMSDIQEGQAAGMWTIAVTRTGNELGLSLSECEVAKRAESEGAKSGDIGHQLAVIAARFREAGADFIVESIADAIPLLDRIGEMIRTGEIPGVLQNQQSEAENPYLLLTPGPLSTSPGVRRKMLRDWCTWDDEYNAIVQSIRTELVQLATPNGPVADQYSAVLMQGSGTFSVESVIGSVIPADGTLLVLSNGAYGRRIAEIAHTLQIENIVHDSPEDSPPDLERLEQALRADASITHVAVVHCETTTGMLNPIEAIGAIARKYNCVYIVDAMSSFGGVDCDIHNLGIDYLVSSANKCIQGVPGFGFVIAKHSAFSLLEKQKIRPRSLALNLYDQWHTMETQGGKWRYTSPTHTVRAFRQALTELADEGGIAARNRRYVENQRTLVAGMATAGFQAFLAPRYQSPIITAFRNPAHSGFDFRAFYESLKAAGFVIYPGKVSSAPTFRIGTIGEVYVADIEALLVTVRKISAGM